jgi:hypothetical protein
MGYTKSEQETILVFDYELNTWSVYSSVPKHIRKLGLLCELEVLESEDGRPISVKGTLNEKQVNMKKERIVSDEQKKIASERMNKMWGKN